LFPPARGKRRSSRAHPDERALLWGLPHTLASEMSARPKAVHGTAKGNDGDPKMDVFDCAYFIIYACVMKCRRLLQATASVILLLPCTGLRADDGYRVWTDVRGREVTARMAGVDGDSIILELKDGRKVPYPLAQLSDADRQAASHWKPAEKPPERTETPATAELNFNDNWPDRVSFKDDPEIEVITENADKKEFIYESANFRYVADARLSKSVVSGFARMFETTHLYCRTLPIGLTGGVKTDGKYLIRLFEKFDDYVSAGGPPTSAGVFMSGKQAILVPFRSLGVRAVGSGYMLDRDKSNKTLPHEIVHQLTPRCYYTPGSGGWFTEGIADYVAVTPYRSGSYNVRGNVRAIVEYATAHGSKNMGGRALGTDILLPPLEKWMLQSYPQFLANSKLNYGSALLITTYFFHMDRESDAARIRKFLAALHAGKRGTEALDVLLDGDSFESLQEQITRAFKRQRIDLKFSADIPIGGGTVTDA
jgi:hypothetical protein